jgi:hypothetical protein
MPVPPIYLRVAQSRDRQRVVREVIDGQQRVSAVLDYVDGKYALSLAMDATYAGRTFTELSPAQQDSIKQYSFVCEVFHGISDSEVLAVFARLNTYSVKLNAQELRNGTYFGYFKQSAYRLAHLHIEFWRRHRIFSEQRIARMLEVEFTSELLILQLAGLQDKKTSIDQFYSELDASFPARGRVEARFQKVLDEIADSLPEGLQETEFRRVPLFYSLFGAVYHRLFGLPGQTQATSRKTMTEVDRRRLQAAIAELSEHLAAAKRREPVPKGRQEFVNACLRQTDNLGPRRLRFETLYRLAFRG